MIEEPEILVTEPDRNFFIMAKEEDLESFFYIQRGESYLILNMLDVERSDISNHYSIFATVIRSGKAYYWFDGKQTTKEEWVDSMISDYPDHFEWILFHPEFMAG